MNDLGSELYASPKTTTLKVREDAGILEANPNEKYTFPFARFYEDLSPVFPVVSIVGENGQEGKPIKLEKVSDLHGRDLDVAVSREAFWFSKDGDYTTCYNNVNIKGARFDKPHVYRNSRGELSIYGLLSLETPEKEGEVINRGKIFRSAGVETEKVELIISPKEFIYEGQKITLEEFRKKLLDDVKIRASNNDVFSTDEVPEIEEYINNFVPIMIVRSQQVPERIADFKKPKTKEQFSEMMGKIFKFVNTREGIAADQEGVRNFKATDEGSIRNYFQTYLPQRIAINVARMHNAGIVHYNLEEENVSGVGSIYDLDTAWGKPIDGQEITIENIKSDLTNLIAGLTKLCTKNELIPGLNSVFENGGSDTFLKSFIENYTSEIQYKIPNNFDIKIWLQQKTEQYFKSAKS